MDDDPQDENESNGDDEAGRPRPLDDTFFQAWVAVMDECLVFGIGITYSKQKGMDLLEAALAKILDGSRPWRENKDLTQHVKGAMRSILSNESSNLSGLVFRALEEDGDPDPATPERDPEHFVADREIARLVSRELFETTRPGTLRHSILLLAREGIDDTEILAAKLGVGKRQIVETRRHLKDKAREIYGKYGERKRMDAKGENE